MAGNLYAVRRKVTDQISVLVPMVGDVLKDEDNYFDVISTIIATPFDMMVQLDDAGIDFTRINAFELFCLTLGHMKELDTSLVIGGIDFKKFEPALDKTNEMVLLDAQDNIVIDQAVHGLMANAVRKMLWIDKQDKKPANEEARKYLIEKARRKLNRKKQQVRELSELEELIIGLVNTKEFKYDYETVKNITIFQFYSSLRQVSHKIKFDNTMIGYYAGTVKFEDLSLADRSWLRS